MHRIEQLLERFHAKTITEKELTELQRHLEDYEKSGLAQYLDDDLKKQRDALAAEKSRRLWQAIEEQVKDSPVETKPQVIKKRMPVYVPLAAVFLLLLGVALWIFFESNDQQLIVEENLSNEAFRLVMLPDSSTVWLNYNSSIQFGSDFSKNHRTVTLSGQAFFDVKRDTTLPFRVRTGDIVTTALGTSFDIRAYQPQAKAEVALFTGLVKIENLEKQQNWFIEPNQQLIYDEQAPAKIQRFNPGLESIWRKDEFAIEEVRFDSLVEVLEQCFANKEIEFATPMLEEELVSGTFRRKDGLENILELICFNKGCTIEKTDENKLLLKYLETQ